MNLETIISKDKLYYMNTYGDRIPVSFSYGKGINLWDTDDNKYYDFLGGIAVNALGYSHPKLVKALHTQIEKLIHTSNLYYVSSQAHLAEMLVNNSCAEKVFFCNSGAEANEGAIKLARIYSRKKGFESKYEIVTLKNSFHGRTLATLAATGQEKYQNPYTPLLPSFKHVTMNNMQELEEAVSDKTCAIMIELIQGEGGVHPLSPDYVKKIVELCEKWNALLIVDEIQTGVGRTGKLFAYEHYDIQPDIFTLAKALGGGVPIGALCAKKEVASSFEPGDHGTTFGGNPLACTAGLTVLNIIFQEHVLENADKMGHYFMEQLIKLKNSKPEVIAEVRGMGLIIGIELKNDIAKEVSNKMLNKGFLIGTVGSKILRLLPPLIIDKDDIDLFIMALDGSL
ncbi:MAG: aspartate aminotransferase family protein [Peptostreptococcales bacterium]|jgi:acetylornithine/N-succinyldiaminopimelate aminotransferase